jgi:hypothetical protein
MPKLPQKLPPWVDQFGTFIKARDKKRDTHHAVDTFLELVKSNWEEFSKQTQAEQKTKPQKKRTIDPVKALGKALELVTERVGEFEDDNTLLNEYKEKLQQAVPDEARPLLQELVGQAPGEESGNTFSDKCSGLIDETSKDLVALATATQNIRTILPQGHETGVMADTAVKMVQRVSDNVNQLKRVLNVE